jgi:hypothetical protein
MSKKKKPPKLPTMAPYRPEEEAYLRRWKGVKTGPPSFFEKFDRDPVYNSTVRSRIDEDGTQKMGTTWGVGKPRGPKGT